MTSASRLGGDVVTRLAREPEHDLAVNEVLGAAQGDET